MLRKPFTKKFVWLIIGMVVVMSPIIDSLHKAFYSNATLLQSLPMYIAVGAVVGVIGGLLARRFHWY